MERSTWIKLPDKLPDEPTVAALSDAAFRLHVTALCYCSRHLTDGQVPDAMIARWGVRAAQRAANELVEAGLWRWHDGGDWSIVGYLETQRSRAEADALSLKRSEAGKRGGKATATAKQVAKQTPSKPQAEVDEEVDEELKTTSADAAVAEFFTAEVSALCDHLANRIEANGSKRPNIGKRWLTAARLLIEDDQRDPVKAHRLIDWCQDDDFERTVVLSMPKFRERYDSLRLKANRAVQASKPKETAAMAKGRRALEVLAEQEAAEGRELSA